VLYHANLGVLQGGFLGVDIFFVISGYLVTGIVKKGIESENFSFHEFYFRRAKRLLPTAYVVFLLTALAAPFVLNAQESKDLVAQLVGALTFSANVVLLFQSGYFSSAAELKPLLHIWSLSIEEQYYLLLPAFLVLMPRKYWVRGGIAMLLGSLLLCVILLTIKPIATFYLLPTRAWELGLGSLAAIMSHQVRRLGFVVSVLFWPNVAILLIIPVVPTGFAHPGLDAFLVCIATLFIILRQHPLLPRLGLARVLAHVGDISYSLYLIHWPLFAFLKNAAVGPVDNRHNFTVVALSVVLAIALYRFVELPTRRLSLRPSSGLIGGGIAASIGLMSVPVAIAALPPAGPDYAYIRRANDGFSSVCVFESNFTPRPECRNADQPNIMVWGDSYAMHLVPGIAASTEKGVIQATRGMCGPFSNLAPLSDTFYLRPWAMSCLAFNRSVIDYLATANSIRTVVLSSPFNQYLKQNDGKHKWRTLRLEEGKVVEETVSVDRAAKALRETITELRSIGKSVVIVAPPPSSGFNIGSCLERKAQGKLIIGSPTKDCSVLREDYKQFYALTSELLASIENDTGVSVIRFDSILCDATRCETEIDGDFLYIDTGHLTHIASRRLLEKNGALNF
jgi:peptidoglycan/LPS O-acetylase OafA/YrhL